ncbi:hypothetical protein [Microbacterium sp. 77mftsu3.1]|uniref:hypothetical protein n=1 Tax=Microbacterium sp. 77mftsu3.1 TaxID=1761802 RepID=UPI00036D3AF7|nr:hypothetical protein [Microbacterium sp. 77mftsu3.1]SDH48457.1 hypothetical protein SAMN04488590_3411 [Microbacterium sp. 77mftsu3.1]
MTAAAAALLRHIAHDFEATTSRHAVTGEDASEDYWRGGNDSIAWVIARLRGQAEGLAAEAEQRERLRQLATHASTGEWCARGTANGPKLYTADGTRLGELTDPAVARYVIAAQPATVLRLLAACDDPAAPTGPIDELEEAAHAAASTPWSHVGVVLQAGSRDLGWLHFSHDMDFVVAADPRVLIRIIRGLRDARGA